MIKIFNKQGSKNKLKLFQEFRIGQYIGKHILSTKNYIIMYIK